MYSPGYSYSYEYDQYSTDKRHVDVGSRCHEGQKQYRRLLRRRFVNISGDVANNNNDRSSDRFVSRTQVRLLSTGHQFRQNCALREQLCHYGSVGNQLAVIFQNCGMKPPVSWAQWAEVGSCNIVPGRLAQMTDHPRCSPS